MDKNKLVYHLAIVSLIIFSIAYVYPTTPHQRLPDSPVYHYTANIITTHGRAPWVTHPLISHLGLTELSTHPFGISHVLSAYNQLGGLDVEMGILILNFFTAMLFVMSSFLLGRKILKNNMMGVLTAFFFTSSYIILNDNTWTATPRGLISGFLPFILLLSVSAYEFDIRGITRHKMLILLGLVLFAGLLIHKIIYLFIPILIVYPLFQSIYPKVKRALNSMFKRKSMEWSSSYIHMSKLTFFSLLFVGSVVLAIQFGTIFFSKPIFLTESSLFTGESLIIMVLNFGVRLARNIRLSIVFSILGFIFLSVKKKSNAELFLFVGLLAIIPFSIRLNYIYNIWAIFMALFAAYGFYVLGYKIVNGKRGFNLLKVAVVAILLTSIIFIPPFVTIREPYLREHVREIHVEEKEVETSIYLRSILEKNESFFVAPDFYGRSFAAFTQRITLDQDGKEITLIENRTLFENLEYDYIFEDGFDIGDFYQSKGRMYRIKEDPLFPGEGYWRGRHWSVFQRQFGNERYHTIVDVYNLRLIVFNEEMTEHYRGNPDRYIPVLFEEEYRIYTNDDFDAFPTI